jgi:hypothetical protein
MTRSARKRPPGREHRGAARPRTGSGSRLALYLPAALAVTLALPGLSFSWLWDDYDFLGRILTFRPAFLLPDPDSVFYRPLSREIYFGVVWLVGGGSVLAGHVANAILLGAVTWLLTVFVTRLTSARAGVIAGVAFASLGAVPMLVAWVSGAQDLLAILFGLLALQLAMSGRAVASACSLAAAILSKETALAILPIAAAMPWILGRRPVAWPKWVLPFAILTLIWAAIHPAPRILLHRHAADAGAGYVGIGPSGRVAFTTSTLLSLVNLPPIGVRAEWLDGRVAAGVVAALIAILAVGLTGRSGSRVANIEPPAPIRVALLGVLLTVLPFLLTAALVKDWIPYYAAMPAIGTSLLIGMALARMQGLVPGAALLGFLAAGIWARGAAPAPTVTCERNLEITSRALLEVESGFKRLHPILPPGSPVLVSVGVTGSESVAAHIDRYQALRVWYRDASILASTPDQRRAGSRPELLFRITPGLDVIEIDAEHATYQSSGPSPPPLEEISRPTRTYARALARGGETDRALRIQGELASIDSPALRPYDMRLAAMYLFMAGRAREADSILAVTPAYPRDISLDMITKVLMETTATDGPQRHVYRAFGIDSLDVAANRYVMRRLLREGYRYPAATVARDVLAIAPGDSESVAILREATRPGPSVKITSPVR